MPERWFTPELFAYLRDLAAHNERPWFQENKARYETHLKEPALRFIGAFGPRLARISPHFRADPRPVGGSLFRIYRDVRFSRDKRPYKTHVGIHFRHERAKDAHAPGFYLHLEPGGCFMGAGIWHPDGTTLGAIRDAIQECPDDWTGAVRRPAFRKRFRLGGDALTRAPRGVDGDHPLLEDLKRKDFIAVTDLEQDAVLSPELLNTFAARCRGAAPLVRFLCEAVDVPF